MLPLRLLLALLLPLSACMRANLLSNTPVVQPPSEARQAFDAATDALRRDYLDRDTVPETVVSHTPQTQSDGHFSVTVTPVRAESQPWNVWPDGTARLFNDAVGYLWLVQLRSTRDVRWSPAHTRLAVNDTEQTFFPVAQADDLLGHLLQGAKWETQVGAPSNLDLRMRNADDFRRAYLGTDPRKGDREGVLLFPAPTRNLQAVAMELTLGVWSEGDGVREYRFLFE